MSGWVSPRSGTVPSASVDTQSRPVVDGSEPTGDRTPQARGLPHRSHGAQEGRGRRRRGGGADAERCRPGKGRFRGMLGYGPARNRRSWSRWDARREAGSASSGGRRSRRGSGAAADPGRRRRRRCRRGAYPSPLRATRHPRGAGLLRDAAVRRARTGTTGLILRGAKGRRRPSAPVSPTSRRRARRRASGRRSASRRGPAA